jgi:prophage antirepressor-like protein
LKNVAEVFNIVSINSHIQDLDDSEKILQDLQTRGGIQKHAFLTEIGFYKFIMRSRKRKSIEFQKWLFTILRELRLKGFYKLDSHKDEKINIEELFIDFASLDLRSYLNNYIGDCNIHFIRAGI